MRRCSRRPLPMGGASGTRTGPRGVEARRPRPRRSSHRPGNVLLLTRLPGERRDHSSRHAPAGYPRCTMERETTLEEVRTFETRGGNVRYVVRDSEGNEYTTFREQIGDKARQLQGKRARIEFHEQQRGQYKNVYLDKVEPAD